jgi:RNAse (barnase) inhibitor barstar
MKISEWATSFAKPYVLAWEGNEISLSNTDIDPSISVFQVDLRNSTSSNSVLKNIGISLRFPGYFGENLNAFKDCLTDGEIMPNGPILLEFINCDGQRLIEISTMMEGVVQNIEWAAEEWSAPHWPWAGQARPLHAIFQSANVGEGFLANLQKARF